MSLVKARSIAIVIVDDDGSGGVTDITLAVGDRDSGGGEDT